jgi:LacI family transcriptional regulator
MISELGEQGHLALVSHAGISGMNEVATIEALLSARVEGLLVTAFWNEEHLDIDVDVPVVYVHHRPSSSTSPLVPSDNTHSTRLAVEHMRFHDIEPAFWTGPDDEGPLGERTRAWREAIGDPSATPFRSHYDAEVAEQEFLKLVSSDAVPRGIICATDQQAFGILAGAYEAGIRVPEQLALISLDGSPETAFTAPPLTTVKQPIKAMVSAAVEALTTNAAIPAELLGELKVRRSCGC